MRFGIPIPHLEYEYSQKLLEGVKQYVKDTGNDFLVYSSKEPEARESDYSYQEWSIVKFLNKNNIDGAVIPMPALSRYVGEKKMADIVKDFSSQFPVVSIVSQVDEVPSLIVNSEKSFKNLIEHLIFEHGRKKILFMGIDCQSNDIRDRLVYFREVMEKRNIEIPEHHVIYADYTFLSATETMQRHFPTRDSVDFDAVVCVTDELALGAMTYLTSLGFSVPEDICITGFDNTIRASYSYPSLTTIDQNVPRQCYTGIKILEDKVTGKNVNLLNVIHSECSFRASCGCLPKNSNYIFRKQDGTYVSRNKDFYSNAFSALFLRNDQNIRILDFIEELQSSLSLEVMCSRLEKYLTSFEINHCALCLYEKPVQIEEGDAFELPSKARIYYASDNNSSHKVIDSKEYFDCEEKLLPGDMLDSFKGVSIVKTIYHGKLQYGYMILSLGSYDCSEYMIIYSLLSKFISSAYEVSQLELKNNNLAILSKTDELTGLLNRRGFMYAAQQELNIAAGIGKSGLVIYGDIDGLKYINDTFGHDAGDRAIKAEVELLKKTFRAADTMGRLGGDEFAILSISLSKRTFEKLKEKLDELCADWNRNTNEEFKLSISLGAFEFDSKNYNLTHLLKLADMELYKIKREKKAGN